MTAAGLPTAPAALLTTTLYTPALVNWILCNGQVVLEKPGIGPPPNIQVYLQGVWLVDAMASVRSEPSGTIWDFVNAVITGNWPRFTVIVCSHVFVFPQKSVASQVRVAINVLVSGRFVMVLSTCRATALQVSETVGSSKIQELVVETVREGAQTMLGRVV